MFSQFIKNLINHEKAQALGTEYANIDFNIGNRGGATFNQEVNSLFFVIEIVK